MKNKDNTKEQLLKEIDKLSKKIADLEKPEVEHKQAEEEIELLSEAVYSSIDGFAMGDINRKITYVNKAFTEMFGYSQEELIGKEISFIYPEDQLTILEKALESAIKGGWVGELIGKRKNGSLFPMEISATRVVDNKGKLIAYMANHRDITERKQAEEKLLKTRERLELAMDAGEHGFWDWNLDTNDVYFSPRYYTMLGYKPGELPMKLETWVDLLHPDDRKTIVAEVENYVKNAQPYEVEFRLKTKGGDWKWISGRGKSYKKDKNGVPHRAVGVHVDITERKQSEKELRKLKNELEIKVAEQTKELKKKVSYLERFYDATIDRELRMKELRDEIDEFKKREREK